MSLEDWKGKTFTVNFVPQFTFSEKELAEELKTAFRSLSIKTLPHRTAMARWIIKWTEEQIRIFSIQIQDGMKEQCDMPPDLTPRQLLRRGGRTSVQRGGGGAPTYQEDKRI